jgi:hypothetical protein
MWKKVVIMELRNTTKILGQGTQPLAPDLNLRPESEAGVLKYLPQSWWNTFESSSVNMAEKQASDKESDLIWPYAHNVIQYTIENSELNSCIPAFAFSTMLHFIY